MGISSAFINVYHIAGAIGTSVVHGDRTWSIGQKLEHRKFFTNVLKILTMKVPRAVVAFPSLEIFKTHLDSYLCGDPALAVGLDSTFSRGHFQPMKFCDSVQFCEMLAEVQHKGFSEIRLRWLNEVLEGF